MTDRNDIKKNIRKDKRFSEEKKILTDIFKDIPENKKSLVSGLIESAAFMRVVLERCQKDIQENGYQQKYQNGASQFGFKRSISAEIYATYSKLYQAAIKQLTPLLPEEYDEDELAQFLNE